MAIKSEKMKLIIYSLSIFFLVSFQHQAKINNCKKSENNDTTAIAEKSFIELGGEKQYVEITGLSKENPVLLFLHGGPGWPQTPHLRYFNSALTKYMTVVSWEQSGCGQSYINNPHPKKLSLEQIIDDAHELTQILKKKFHKNKIYLVGFSWGSMPGLKLVEKYPEDYAAYFGITQVININRSIKVSRAWITKQATLKGDKETLKTLQQLETGDTSVCKRKIDCFLTQYGLLNKYGGALFTKKGEEEIAKAETFYDDYKKYDWFGAFLYSAYRVENDLFDADLSTIKKVKVPMYFIMGRHDWNLPTSITLEYIKKLSAPKKEIIWFEQSGHEPLSEEASKFNQVIIDRVKK